MMNHTTKKRIRRLAFVLAATICLCPLYASAGEADQSVREFYHKHTGSIETEGGCYTKKVLHVHKGSSTAGGGCYGTPILHGHKGSQKEGGDCYQGKTYHSHSGNEAAGGACYESKRFHAHQGSEQSQGGCYSVPVYHTHQGDAAAGGACYAPVKHAHTGTCMTSQSCQVTIVRELEVIRTYDEYCYHHNMTQHAVVRGIFNHSACGRGQTEENSSVCWTCKYYTGTHSYQSAVCGKTEETVEGYQVSCLVPVDTPERFAIGCGKNGETIEGYDLSCKKSAADVDSYYINCGKTDDTIEGYALSCKKTDKTIEQYEKGCGQEEKDAYARLTLTNKTPKWTAEDVSLLAELSDEKNYLNVEKKSPFLWNLEGGEAKDTKGSISAEENGTYVVRLHYKEASAGHKDDFVSLVVSNIDRTPPLIKNVAYSGTDGGTGHMVQLQAEDIQPDGKPGSGLAEAPYSFDGGQSWTAKAAMEATENGVLQIRVRDLCGNMAASQLLIEDIKKEDNTGGEEEKEEETEKPKEEETEKPKEEEKEDQEEPKEDDKTEDTGGGDGNGNNQGGGDGNGDNQGGGESQEPEDDSRGDTGGNGQVVVPKKDPVPVPPTPVKPVPKPKNTVKKADQNNSLRPVDGRTLLTEKKGETAAVKKTEKSVDTLKVDAEAVPVPVKNLKQKGAMPPIVRALTFTLAALAAIASIIWAVLLWMKNVKIYHSDGEGKQRYAGSCTLAARENGYELVIPQRILEQSLTGEYCLRPSALFLKWYEGKELIVIAGDQKEAVWMEEEIPLRLSYYA